MAKLNRMMRIDGVTEPASAAGASPWVLVAVMVVLAGLDLLGTFLAKEWTAGRGPWMFVGGAASFVVLFTIFAVGLRVAELSTVTFGWIVGLQVGVLLVERMRYGVTLPTGKWLAIGVIVTMQAYLVLAPNTASARSSDTPVLVEDGSSSQLVFRD
jgi:hypothetical protein